MEVKSQNLAAWKIIGLQQASRACCKILRRLELIPEDAPGYNCRETDFLPLRHYALLGFYSEEQACKALAIELGMEFKTFSRTEKGAVMKVLAELTQVQKLYKVFIAARVLPISETEDCIELGMANPFDSDTVRAIEFMLEKKAKIVVVREIEITQLLHEAQSQSDQHTIEFVLESESSESDEAMAPEITALNSHISGEYSSSVEHIDNCENAVIRIVDYIFSQSMLCAASDVHISPQQNHLSVKVRVDGIITPLLTIPIGLRDRVISRLKVLCGMDIAERRLPQDGRLRITSSYGMRDVRMSSVPSAFGENLVARILPTSVDGLTFQSLGMNPEIQKIIETTLRQTSKVNLVVGPTGSGKTSTLYAMLLRMATGSQNVITLEDPIEYRLAGVTQIQINQKLKLSFAEGLRSVLRQDPDVVLVGEIRDQETASISMNVAQTGHIVFSTLHTTSAPEAIVRLRGLGVPTYLAAAALGTIVAQRLVRKNCPNCLEPITNEQAARLESRGIISKNACLSTGCEQCNGKGYRGRTGLFSILEVNQDIKEAINSEQSERVISEIAKLSGFKTLHEAGIEAVEAGLTSLDEIERVLGPVEAKPGRSVPPRAMKIQSHQRLNSLSQKQRILLVDDDEDTLLLLRTMLENDAFEVVSATNAADALELFDAQEFSLVLSDIRMPEMDGFALTNKLRLSNKEDVPVILMSVEEDQEMKELTKESGANEFVSKKSGRKNLLDCIIASIH